MFINNSNTVKYGKQSNMVKSN